MAEYYLSNVVGGNSGGANWGAAFTTLAAAVAAATADDDVIFWDSGHDETVGATINLDAVTAGQRLKLISVNRGGRTGSSTGHDGWQAGAKIRVGAVSAALNVITARAQALWVWGVRFFSGTAANTLCDIALATYAGAHTSLEMYYCEFHMGSTHTAATLLLGAAGSATMFRPDVSLHECTVYGPSVAANSMVTFRCGRMTLSHFSLAYFGGTKPTTCFAFSGGGGQEIEIIDSDLSGYDNGSGNYFLLSGWQSGYVNLRSCKLSPNPGFVSGTFLGSTEITRTMVDDTGADVTVEVRNRLGTLTESTAVKVTDEQDVLGQKISFRLQTTSECNQMNPFVLPWGLTPILTTTAKHGDLEFIRDNVTNLTDRDVWGQFEVLGSAGSPKGTLTIKRNAEPVTGAPAPCDSSSLGWTHSMTNPNRQRIRHSFTPGAVCTGRARLFVGLAGADIYISPQYRVTDQ